MCIQCWKKYGRVQIDSAAVRETAAAITEVYEYSCVGGNLHIAIDDWNLEDGNLDFCAGSIHENVHEAGPEQLEAESRCLALLRSLTEDERASALALHDGFWGKGGTSATVAWPVWWPWRGRRCRPGRSRTRWASSEDRNE